MAEYKIKARLHHPDKEGNTEQFQEIQVNNTTCSQQCFRNIVNHKLSNNPPNFLFGIETLVIKCRVGLDVTDLMPNIFEQGRS